jgi:hypothetical protein
VYLRAPENCSTLLLLLVGQQCSMDCSNDPRSRARLVLLQVTFVWGVAVEVKGLLHP